MGAVVSRFPRYCYFPFVWRSAHQFVALVALVALPRGFFAGCALYGVGASGSSIGVPLSYRLRILETSAANVGI